MKTALLTVIMTGMLAAQAQVANAQDHDNHGAANDAMAPGEMMGMMNHEQMMQMQEHMQEMQKLMADIQAETDPDRRMAMMQEHMKEMNEAMGMMGGAMMGHTGGGNMADMDMEERMQMMQNQMGMMGMMMQQMMHHFSAETLHHGE